MEFCPECGCLLIDLDTCIFCPYCKFSICCCEFCDREQRKDRKVLKSGLTIIKRSKPTKH